MPAAGSPHRAESLNAEQRTLLRAAIDARQRARRDELIAQGDIKVCASCGCDRDTFSIGCTPCSDRRRKLRLRGDDEYRALEQAQQNQARVRRRLAA